MQRRAKLPRRQLALALRAGLVALALTVSAGAQEPCPCCDWSPYRGDVEFDLNFAQQGGVPWAAQQGMEDPGMDEGAWMAEGGDVVFGDGQQAYPMHECWGWQVVPSGLIYRSYLAGPREPRLGTVYFHQTGGDDLWDTTLGARVGLLRYGNYNAADPEGFQIDVEGAAFPRLGPESDMDLTSVDFRAGMPLTWRRGKWRYKAAYYHLSSHLGDEYQLKNPDVERLNYVYDALVFGASYYPIRAVRLYGEASWAFHYKGGASPWEFQFGADVSPARPSGLRGDPFVAANVYLREAVDYGGSFTFQTGWQWRGGGPGHLLRLGVQYFDGKSVQFEFYNQTEQQIGVGVWYDF